MRRIVVLGMLLLGWACSDGGGARGGNGGNSGGSAGGSAGAAGTAGTGGIGDTDELCAACDPACPAPPPHCWCPGADCERTGCIDGVAWNCRFYGDCADQLPADDCAAAGLSCYTTAADGWSGTAYCAPTGCGDGVVQDGEACDEGPENGTRLDGCTKSCAQAPAAVRDQVHAAADEELERIPYRQADFAAIQTFTPAVSGRLAWIVADVTYGGLFELRGDAYELLAASTLVEREVDERVQNEHHFFEPVFVEAGKRYAFALQCGLGRECDLPITRGDRYPGGALLFRAYPSRPESVPEPAPADADVPFETWVITEDDGCFGAPPVSVPGCEACGGLIELTCIAGEWTCGCD